MAGWHCLSLWAFLAADQCVGEEVSDLLYTWRITASMDGRFQLEEAPFYAHIVGTLLFVILMLVTQFLVSAVILRVCTRIRRRAYRMSIRCIDWMTGLRFAAAVSILVFFMKAWVGSWSVILVLIMSLEVLGVFRFIKVHIRNRAITIVPLCQQCRYDLRGSPQGICPECGTKRLQRTKRKRR